MATKTRKGRSSYSRKTKDDQFSGNEDLAESEENGMDMDEDDFDDDEELLGLAGAGDEFDDDDDDEEEEEDEVEEYIEDLKPKKSRMVSVTSKGSKKNVSVTLNFKNKRKFSKIFSEEVDNEGSSKKGKTKKTKSINKTKVEAPSRGGRSKANSSSKKLNLDEINEDEDEDEDEFGEEEEEEDEELIEQDEEQDDEVDENSDEFYEFGSDMGDSSDLDLSKLSERQRSKILGKSEDSEDLSSDYYNNKNLPRSVLALMHGNKKKEALTEEEIQFRKADTARKRKIFVARKLEEEKKETLKKLLYRKIEKVDAKAQQEEDERRKLNQSKRKELIKHSALFSWVSKTEVVNNEKTNVSFYSMQ